MFELTSFKLRKVNLPFNYENKLNSGLSECLVTLPRDSCPGLLNVQGATDLATICANTVVTWSTSFTNYIATGITKSVMMHEQFMLRCPLPSWSCVEGIANHCQPPNICEIFYGESYTQTNFLI